MNRQTGRILRVLLMLLVFAAHALPAQEVPQVIKKAVEAPAYPPAMIYPLRYAKAGDVAGILEEVYSDAVKGANLRVAPDARTNSLIINASDSVIKEVEDLLKALDAAQAPPPQALKATDEIKVFSLENAKAADAKGIVSDLVGNVVKLTADERTNSLIGIGPKGDLEVVEALLLRLDESQEPRLDVRAYILNQISVEDVAKSLEKLGVDADFAVDAQGGRLLVRAKQDIHKSVAEFLQAMESPMPEAKTERMQLRIIWLVDEKLAGKEAREPAKNLEKVVKVLEEKLGVTNLKMAAQVFINVDVAQGRPFTAQGTTSFSEVGEAELAVEGMVNQTPTTTMDISIRARQVSQRSSRGDGFTRNTDELASINTSVAAPLGHSIILGMAPIQSADSVFVLQVLDNEEPAGPKK